MYTEVKKRGVKGEKWVQSKQCDEPGEVELVVHSRGALRIGDCQVGSVGVTEWWYCTYILDSHGDFTHWHRVVGIVMLRTLAVRFYSH